MNWITNKEKSFKEESEGALSIFRATVSRLAEVNKKIMERSDILTEQVKSLELERDEINDIALENGRIMKNINKILD